MEIKNIIWVFTHYSSLTRKERKSPMDRLHDFKTVVQNYSSFGRPIFRHVFAENKANDWDLQWDEQTLSHILLNKVKEQNIKLNLMIK